MRCPRCKNRVLQKVGNETHVRIDGRPIFDAEGKCRAKCYWCKEQIEIPLEVRKGTPVVSETFYLKPSS